MLPFRKQISKLDRYWIRGSCLDGECQFVEDQRNPTREIDRSARLFAQRPANAGLERFMASSDGTDFTNEAFIEEPFLARKEVESALLLVSIRSLPLRILVR